MKRIFPWLLVLPLFVVACAEETPVKEVRTCSKVVKVELVKRFYSPLPTLSDGGYIWVKLTTVDGTHFYNRPSDYSKYYFEGKELKRRELGLAEVAEKMEMGKEYCWTTYESIG